MNPLARPATILGENPARKAYGGLVDKVLADVEQKRQREELKKAQIDEALLPPDIDLAGTFAPEMEEITSGLNEYSQWKADLATQGVDLTTPEYKTKLYQKENEFKNKAIQSKQHQASYANAVKLLSDPKNEEFFDTAKSQEKIAGFLAAAQQGVGAAEQYIKDNGSLLVPVEFDVAKYGAELAKDYKTTITESDPIRKGGLYQSTTIEKQSPENKLGYGERFLRKPQAKIEAEFYYSALSPQAQAEWDQKAIDAGGQAGDGIKMFAAKKYGDPSWQEKETIETRPVPSGGGPTKTPAPESNIVIDGLTAALRGDPSVVQTTPQGMKVYSGLEGVQIGTFEREEVINYEDGSTTTEYKSTPVLIEKMFQDTDGKWYYTTNETKANRKGKTVNGVPNSVPMTAGEAMGILARATVGTGELTDQEFNAYLKKKGLINEQGIFTPTGSTANDKDIYFEGTNYVVKKSDIQTINNEKVATLPDGRKVKWSGSEWVKYEEGGNKQEDLRKKYNY